MRRHIAHVITKLDVGGAQTHVVELALGQIATGNAVAVVAGSRGPAADKLQAAGVHVEVVPELAGSHGRLSQRAAVASVTRAIRSMGPDIVHGHSSNGGLAARVGAHRLGVPSVYTAHGWPFQSGAPLKQRLMSFAGEFVGGRLGDAVIVLTEAERDRARRARVAPPRRVFVVPNGISDVDRTLRRRVGPPRGSPEMVMVARFAPPKLQGELVTALSRLADLPWTMRFVGDGPERAACERLAEHHRLGDRIDFLGHSDDVAQVLSTSDVGILWSRYEGLPISVIEYLRAGLCCVCSDLPGTRELLGERAGVLGQSVGSLRDLLEEPDRISTFAEAARQRYEQSYTVAAMVDATERVYAAVMS